ncbi:MAG: cytochrome c [Bacteroidetes bacterium]|nr:cytochrome c [Bacteroidota bacterium]
MNKRNLLAVAISASMLLMYSCGGGNNEKPVTDETPNPQPAATTEAPAADASAAKGVGKFKTVELTHPLDEKMVKAGQSIYDVKCSSCHKTTDEKLVGPGWKGVTDRRAPEWIMNFVTNTDEMLDKDAEAKALMEVCMVRMPNQNLKDDEARSVLEFMRKNDGKN